MLFIACRVTAWLVTVRCACDVPDECCVGNLPQEDYLTIMLISRLDWVELA
jgi:hypothetical protein